MDVEKECRTTRFRRSEYECWRANRPGDADTIDDASMSKRTC